MQNKERVFIASVLLAIVVLVIADLMTDLNEGARGWHVALEGAIAFFSSIGVFLLIRDSLALKHSLAKERARSSQLHLEAEKWKSQSKKFVEGLSQTIDDQLTRWNLTHSEKQVAFLLLKGLSSKEIAVARKTTEKTARTQSMAIYSKAGLAGRSELAAFFLEDLLPPSNDALTAP